MFKTGPPRRVGIKLEWLVQDAVRPQDPVRAERLAAALTEQFDPPLAGTLTTEPGGQLELSSPPAPLAACIAGAAADLDRLAARVATAGLVLTGVGLDPRPPMLQAATPRYRAMARHFARYRGVAACNIGGRGSSPTPVRTRPAVATRARSRSRSAAAPAIQAADGAGGELSLQLPTGLGGERARQRRVKLLGERRGEALGTMLDAAGGPPPGRATRARRRPGAGARS